MAPAREEFRQAYSRVLGRFFHGNQRLQTALELLAKPDAEEIDVEVDSQVALTQRFLDSVGAALAAIGSDGRFMLQAAAERDNAFVQVPKTFPPEELLVDFVARRLLESLAAWPDQALELAVATGRLVEEVHKLNPLRRQQIPLGVGFDEPLERRLRLRFALLDSGRDAFAALSRHEVMLLEAPDTGRRAIEADLGRKLSRREREWLDAERFARMLEWSRSEVHKNFELQIRRYLRLDPTHGPVLDRYGARGHWLAVGKQGPAVLARAGVLAARTTDEERSQDPRAWRALVVGKPMGKGAGRRAGASAASPAVAPIEEAYSLAPSRRGPPLKAEDLTIGTLARQLADAAPGDAERAVALAGGGIAPPPSLFPTGATLPSARQTRAPYELSVRYGSLCLSLVDDPITREPLARVPLDSADEPMLDFQDILGRVAEGAPILDRIDPDHTRSPTVRWARALLSRQPPPPSPDPDDLTDLKVRLVYIPASLEHPLGGLPTIGLRYLADHLERQGARADVMTLGARDLRRRRAELLGADVIGLSVYLTNDDKVAREVSLLREAGFEGQIVLGGPHLREVDRIQEEVSGWDALIRGEGEEVFPQVLRVLRRLDAGETERALETARSLRGTTIARGNLVVLADTAARNAVAKASCPLPFEWRRHNEATTLKMNFTRGCPYSCGFCPNHQGRHPHSGDADEIWSFTRLAAADALTLPRAQEERIARAIQAELKVEGPPSLRLALNLLLRDPVRRELLEEIGCEPGVTGVSLVPRRDAKRHWLDTKALFLKRARLRGADDTSARDPNRAELRHFEIMTSEDNTLANKKTILAYLGLRRQSDLADAVTFDPGQNTVRDLTDYKGGLDLLYVDALCDRNPFRVVLGVDGTSNPVLRQNQKPHYTIGEAVALNRALAERGIEVLNNYILLNPETNLLEAIESFALFVLLPINWRDHGKSINLRITKEPGTRSHDEGLLFVPEPTPTEWNDPLRYAEVEAMLASWDLTAEVHSAALPGLLWELLAEDPRAQRILPQVVRRWQRDPDHDPFLVGLARRIVMVATPDRPLVAALRQVSDEYAAAWPAEPAPIHDLTASPTAVIEDLFERTPSAGWRPARRAPRPAPRDSTPDTERDQAEAVDQPPA